MPVTFKTFTYIPILPTNSSLIARSYQQSHSKLTRGDKTFGVEFRNIFCKRCFIIIKLKIGEEKDLRHCRLEDRNLRTVSMRSYDLRDIF